MGGCYRCLKLLVALFNCLIMIVGIAIMGVSLWVLLDASLMSGVSSSALYVIYFFISLGAALIVLGFLGNCGALQESQCLLGTYFCLVLLLIGGQVAVCVWAYVNFKEIEGDFTSAVKDTLQLYQKNDAMKASVDLLQQKLECCGSAGPRDWQALSLKESLSEENVFSAIADAAQNSVAFSVPQSCCKSPHEPCNTVVPISLVFNSSIHEEGCSKRVFDWIKANKQTLLLVVLGVTLVEVFAMIFSLILCIAFRKIDQYY